jgi:hypothetical protein
MVQCVDPRAPVVGGVDPRAPVVGGVDPRAPVVGGVDPHAPVVGGVDLHAPVVGSVAHCGPATAGRLHIVGQAAPGTQDALLQKISFLTFGRIFLILRALREWKF